MGSYSLAMETPSTERIRELSERLDSLRGELVSERTKAKESAPPAVVPAAAPVRNPVVLVGEPMPPPHVLATSSASQQQIDLLSNQLATLRSELSSSKPPAMGMPASYSTAYAANAPPAAVPTQAGLVAPEDFHSPTKTHVHNVHDTLCRVQDAFTNERRINDEVANSKLLVVDNLISQTAALRLKKITEIREKADDFVHELNRMREEDKVREMVYADLFFQTKTALQSAIQGEEDARKLLEQALQLQISDMMDAIKVEIDRDNRERERSEEARREKFQRDAMKIRETLDDDRQDLKDLDTRLTTEIQSRLTAIELELQQEVEDRTYVQDKREDLVKEGLQLIKEKLTNEQNHRGLSYDRILKKIDLDISQTSANIRSQTMMRESSEASLIHVMENLAVQVKEELKTEKVERKKTDVGLIRVLEETFTTYN